MAALNAQVPGEGGTEGVGYTGFTITLDGVDKVDGIKVYANDQERQASLDGDNFIKLYAAVADRSGEEGSYTWTARINEKVEWKLEWLDGEGKVIGRTFFTTKVVLGAE